MSDVIERIKKRINENMYRMLSLSNNCIALSDNEVNGLQRTVYDECLKTIDEELAKEQQEEHKCSECVRESIQAECVLDGCKFKQREPQECEWNYDGDGYYLHGNDWISGKSDFKYCPYCGRKIKVAE